MRVNGGSAGGVWRLAAQGEPGAGLAEPEVTEEAGEAGSADAAGAGAACAEPVYVWAEAGRVEAVEKMGLQNWFLQQLQPEKIDDSAFEQRMNEYPALRLSQDELMKRFPSQQMLRMAERAMFRFRMTAWSMRCLRMRGTSTTRSRRS